jgi:hypothetical protein
MAREPTATTHMVCQAVLADAPTYVPRPVLVHVLPERNERMGLHGRDGFRVIYPCGMSVWLPDDVFAAAFKPADRYWREG